MENSSNDYSDPNALVNEFEEIEDRLCDLEERNQKRNVILDRLDDIWAIGIPLAMILSWSRNASILYCIGHGIASWIYVIYFAFTR